MNADPSAIDFLYERYYTRGPFARAQRLPRFVGNRPVDLSIQTAARASYARPDGRGGGELHRRVHLIGARGNTIRRKAMDGRRFRRWWLSGCLVIGVCRLQSQCGSAPLGPIIHRPTHGQRPPWLLHPNDSGAAQAVSRMPGSKSLLKLPRRDRRRRKRTRSWPTSSSNRPSIEQTPGQS